MAAQLRTACVELARLREPWRDLFGEWRSTRRLHQPAASRSGCSRPVDSVPLSAYRNRSVYTMRTDAYDRFAIRLEKRFTKEQIGAMLPGSVVKTHRKFDFPLI